MQKVFSALMAMTIMLMVGCAKFIPQAVEVPLTVADIEPTLAAFGGEDFGFVDSAKKPSEENAEKKSSNGDEEPVEGPSVDRVVTYMQIGDPSYDDFFRSAAKLDGLVLLSKSMTAKATGQLKKFAQSKASDDELKDQIREIVGDTPSDQWTVEQSVAVMDSASGQKKIRVDEIKYFATTTGSIGLTVVSLTKSVKETKGLITQGQDLLQNVKSLKPTLVPAATKGLKASISNLQGVAKNAPALVEEMTVLAKGFGALAGQDSE